MNRSNKLLWLAVLIMVPAGLIWQYYPLGDASARLRRLPHGNGDLQSWDVPLAPAEKSVFAAVDVVKRVVTAGDDRAFVTIIDGTRDRHAVHDPAFCFRGAGWEIIGAETFPLKGGPGRLLHLRQGAQTAQALYWFSDGNEKYDRPLLYWWKTSLRRLTLGRSGNEPVLIVLTSAGQQAPDWQKLLNLWPEIQSI